MRKSYIVLALILFAVSLFAAEPIHMPELKRPQKMELDSQQIYINEGATIFIYSLKDFKLKKKFGKEGVGPAEMKPMPHLDGAKVEITVLKDRLSIFSRNKISYFTKKGEFIKEMKAVYGLWHKPLGDLFIGRGTLVENGINYLTVNLYDHDFKIVKEVCRFESANQRGKKIQGVGSTPSTYLFEDNKVFIDHRKAGMVHVFDYKGNKLYDITVQPEKVEFTSKDKDAYFTYFSKHPALKDQFHIIKNRLEFPDKYPYYKTLNVADNRLYIQTYKTKDHHSQFLIYDLKGKKLNDVMLPLVAESVSIDYPYVFKDGKLYQLVEDLDQEEWFLHITPIK